MAGTSNFQGCSTESLEKISCAADNEKVVLEQLTTKIFSRNVGFVFALRVWENSSLNRLVLHNYVYGCNLTSKEKFLISEKVKVFNFVVTFLLSSCITSDKVDSSSKDLTRSSSLKVNISAEHRHHFGLLFGVN